MKEREVFLIQPDCDPESPREWDNLGTLYTWHPRYTLGGPTDENNQSPPDHEDLRIWMFDQFTIPGLESFYTSYGYLLVGDAYDVEVGSQPWKYFTKTVDEWASDNLCILPVYLYDHSGITVSTSSFSCRWDSGQVGFIYVTKDKAGDDWGCAEACLKSEIETLAQYLEGDVYGFTRFELSEDFDIEGERPFICTEHYEAYIITEYDYKGWFNECVDYDSCWGFYGHDCIEQECESMAKRAEARCEQQAEADAEKRRRAFWCM